MRSPVPASQKVRTISRRYCDGWALRCRCAQHVVPPRGAALAAVACRGPGGIGRAHPRLGQRASGGKAQTQGAGRGSSPLFRNALAANRSKVERGTLFWEHYLRLLSSPPQGHNAAHRLISSGHTRIQPNGHIHLGARPQTRGSAATSAHGSMQITTAPGAGVHHTPTRCRPPGPFPCPARCPRPRKQRNKAPTHFAPPCVHVQRVFSPNDFLDFDHSDQRVLAPVDIASRRWERRCRMVARMLPQSLLRAESL